MARRLIAATASAVLILGLAACDDGKGPVTTPPPDLGFEPQTSDGGGDESEASDGGGDDGASDGGGDGDTQAAPDIPAPDRADFPGMDEHTEEGAAQAFRYYIAMSMWAHQTGDDSSLPMLEDPDCSSCAELNATIAPLKEHNEYWSEFDITDVGIRTHDSDLNDVEVGYLFTISSHTRPNDTFKDRVDVPELEYSTVGGMNWNDGAWKVSGINAEWGTDAHE